MKLPQINLSSSALLWATAFILGGLIIVQLGRSQAHVGGRSPDAALAAAFSTPMIDGSVSRVGEYTVMTFNGGNDDILAILDGRAEELFLYRVRNMNEFDFLGRDTMPNLFATARKLGAGRK